jgi:hypothetical protein
MISPSQPLSGGARSRNEGETQACEENYRSSQEAETLRTKAAEEHVNERGEACVSATATAKPPAERQPRSLAKAPFETVFGLPKIKQCVEFALTQAGQFRRRV